MITTLYVIVILAILIICGITASKVVQIYLYSTKNKELWKKEIKEEKDYEFIKGLY
ncbi:hypothetical protein [Myroides pelagicus]|uniref:hypothetical protein n=1 Tax=Myroides pelagicus TaxID=270914 RepID=UPI0013C2FDA3|nr:hypothetical protein [Myroides pelagicus]MEC4114739.1 hypothetical protein [Myroides pelagicus]